MRLTFFGTKGYVDADVAVAPRPLRLDTGGRRVSPALRLRAEPEGDPRLDRPRCDLRVARPPGPRLGSRRGDLASRLCVGRHARDHARSGDRGPPPAGPGRSRRRGAPDADGLSGRSLRALPVHRRPHRDARGRRGLFGRHRRVRGRGRGAVGRLPVRWGWLDASRRARSAARERGPDRPHDGPGAARLARQARRCPAPSSRTSATARSGWETRPWRRRCANWRRRRRPDAR